MTFSKSVIFWPIFIMVSPKFFDINIRVGFRFTQSHEFELILQVILAVFSSLLSTVGQCAANLY